MLPRKSSDDDELEVVLGNNRFLYLLAIISTLTSGLLHNSYNSARLQTLWFLNLLIRQVLKYSSS